MDGAPEHADTKILGEVASYCTMENVQDYTLTARRPSEAMYALIVISDVREMPGDNNAHIYMVDKVHALSPTDIATLRPLLKRLSMFAKKASQSEAALSSPIKW